MADWRATELLSPLERDVVQYAEVLSLTPANVPDDLFARLRDHFDDGQLVELTQLIATENARARFNRAFRVEPDGYRRE